MTSEQRQASANGIWLCQNCAKLIDSDLTRFPVQLLKKWRDQAERQAQDALGKTSHKLAGDWQEILFDTQRSIRFALSGHALTEQDVEACPALPEVQYVAEELRRRHSVAIIGESGSGKSITAYQAAHILAREGWKILRCSDPSLLGDTLLKPKGSERVLLMVDNAQALTAKQHAYLRRLASDHIAILSITTAQGTLSHGAVVIDPRRAVEVLAEQAMVRRQAWTPLIREFDSRVGDEPFDVPYPRRVADAAEAKSPWLFFFTLRGEERRAHRRLESLRALDRADVYVALVAIGQFLYLDTDVSPEWFARALRATQRDDAWALKAQQAAVGLGAIEADRNRCPHFRYARGILEAFFNRGSDPEVLRTLDFVRECLVAESVPVQGIAWLLRCLFFTEMHWHSGKLVTDDVKAAVVDRWRRANDHLERRNATLAMDAMLLWRPERHQELLPLLGDFGRMISTATAVDAYALGELVNSLHNSGRSHVRRLCKRIDTSALGAIVRESHVADWFPIAYLLDRLQTGSLAWGKKMAPLLRAADLPNRARMGTGADLASIAKMAWAAYCADRKLGFEIVESAMPIIADGLVAQPAHCWQEIRDGIIWGVLGNSPFGDSDPSDEQSRVARVLAEKLDVKALAEAIEHTPYRDWESIAELLFFIGAASAEVAQAIVARISLDALDAESIGRWEYPRRAVLLMMAALQAGGVPDRSREWIERHTARIRRIADSMLLIHARWAMERLEAGAELDVISQNGGPHWERLAACWPVIAQCSLPVVLRVADTLIPLAAYSLGRLDGPDVDGMEEWLIAIAATHPHFVKRTAECIDVELASLQWPSRVTSVTKARVVLRRAISTLDDVHPLVMLARSLGVFDDQSHSAPTSADLPPGAP